MARLHVGTAGRLARSLVWRFVSEHTVQDHLEAIFAKIGATSRRDFLARVLAP